MLDITDPQQKCPVEMRFRQVLKNLSPNRGAQMLRYGWSKLGILSLGQGEGCLKTPDFISDAAYQALQDGETFYAPALGVPALRDEISTYYKNLMGLDIPRERIFVTGSGTTAMHLSLTSILEKGDEVVAITPIWKNLLGAVELAEAKTLQIPLTPSKTGWSLDLDKVLKTCTDKTKAIMIVTPSNPTGWVMPPEQMKALLDFTRERGIWIISDEVYNRGVYGINHAPSFLEMADPHDRLFTINSFSKNYAMTGWRLGWLIGPAESENVIRDVALYDNMGPPTYAQYGAIAALRDGEDFITTQKTSWQKNLDTITARFEKNPRIFMPPIKSTFYVFFKVEGEPDCLTFCKRLIDEAALSLAPGCAFGKDSKGWIRMCFAVSPEKINDALDRLEKVIGTV